MMSITDITLPYLITIIVASLVAAFGGHWLVAPIVDCLRRRFSTIPGAGEVAVGPRTDKHLAVRPFIAWLGRIERAVYTASVMMGVPEAIAIILALKATPSLKEWSENQPLGRATFNIWLIGNLLSVTLSVLTAALAAIIWTAYLDC